MTFSVGDVDLNGLIESRETIEQEIKKLARVELAELDARRLILQTLLGEEAIEICHRPTDPTKKKPRYSVVSLAKYRDPETGKVWSGKGKRPRWFDINRAGDFLISA